MTSLATLGAELVAYAAGVSLSPLHIGLLLLMLLGPNPIQRGSWFVLSWMVTIGGMVVLLLTVGHSLLLTMDQGSVHRTGLDLLAAGALLALGIKELLERRAEGDDPPAWTRKLNRFSALPLPLLMALGVGIELASPDDLFLFAKSAGAILAAGLSTRAELAWTAGFTLVASLALLLPLLALGGDWGPAGRLKPIPQAPPKPAQSAPVHPLAPTGGPILKPAPLGQPRDHGPGNDCHEQEA